MLAWTVTSSSVSRGAAAMICTFDILIPGIRSVPALRLLSTSSSALDGPRHEHAIALLARSPEKEETVRCSPTDRASRSHRLIRAHLSRSTSDRVVTVKSHPQVRGHLATCIACLSGLTWPDLACPGLPTPPLYLCCSLSLAAAGASSPLRYSQPSSSFSLASTAQLDGANPK